MLKRTICIVVALAAAGPALARPNTLAMSCTEATGLVRAQGAVVLSTGQFIYDRYVASRAFCLPGEIIRRVYVPTADERHCRIGSVCRFKIPRQKN